MHGKTGSGSLCGSGNLAQVSSGSRRAEELRGSKVHQKEGKKGPLLLPNIGLLLPGANGFVRRFAHLFVALTN